MKPDTLSLAATTLFVATFALFSPGQERTQAPPTCGPSDPSVAAVRPTYPAAWAAAYPGSFSLDNVTSGTGASCQLCHEGQFGGDGWNAYGWDLKTEVDGGASIANALAAVEAKDSDGDGAPNLEEITASTQPGWTTGANNRIFFDDGSTMAGQTAPASILGALDRISFPTALHNGSGANPQVLADVGGDPLVSPLLNDTSEPFQLSLDCSNALGSGIRTIVVRPQLLGTPVTTSLGELLIKGPVLQRFPGVHTQNVVTTPKITVPYKLQFLGVKVYAQGFCGNGAGQGGFLTNVLEHRVGI